MNNKDDYTKAGLDDVLGQGTTPAGQQRRDPSFSHFVDPHDEVYEEPDRDTDFDAGYQTDSVEEDEEFDDAFPGEDDDPAFAAQTPDIRYDAEPDDDEEPDDWLEEDEIEETEAADSRQWPVGLIIVAIVALVLLGAGGYGVMQQRAATEAELRQLRAALATSASPEEVRASRGALQELQRSYDKLAADAEALTLENRRLSDTVAGLESQAGVQKSAMANGSSVAAKPASPAGDSAVAAAQPVAERFAPLQSQSSAAKPATKPAQIPAATDTAGATPAPADAPRAEALPTKPAASSVAATPPTSTASGQWFVNFGSYATRSMAESWAAKLNPGAGNVIIAPNTSAGKTLYRLRVVGLADRDTAKAVARKLETEQRVSELWVGKD
jgi:cell division protein FtsN